MDIQHVRMRRQRSPGEELPAWDSSTDASVIRDGVQEQPASPHMMESALEIAAEPGIGTEREGVEARRLTQTSSEQGDQNPASQPGANLPSISVENADDDDDDPLTITGRMARQTRDPTYFRLQQLLARRRRRRSALVELTLVVDLIITFASLILAQQYREVLSHIVPVELHVHVWVLSDTLVLAGLVAVIWPITFSLLGLYKAGWSSDFFSPLRAMVAVGLSSFAVSAMLYFLQADRTRWFLLSFTVLDAVLVGLARMILRPLASAHGVRRRVLVVGTGRVAVDAARSVLQRKRLGFEFLGTVGPEPQPLVESLEADEWTVKRTKGWVPPRLGEIRDAPHLVNELEVDDVVLALAPRERREASWILSAMAHLPVRISVLPDVVTETARTTVTSVDGMPFIGVTDSAISGWQLRIKRIMDLVITIPMVVILAPVMLAITVAIRMSSSGPALFKQVRVGQHNRRFTMYKYRTMYVDADKRAREVAVQTEQGLVHKRRDDPRITPVGRFLRRTSLDELPQLLNVVLGDMSLVGPRPELPWIVERYRAWQYYRLLVPQGITGWWQVHGRSDRVLHLHTQDDIYYVRNYSLWLDVQILLMTIRSVLTGKGAF